ncbi:hypothetical protein [Mycolicibacterium vinylchloridicum]|nr:hypothetical protein [Mycolicibacterium vinylchloridicum]
MVVVQLTPTRKPQSASPSGQLNAYIATANVYGTTIRDSGVCAGA